MGRHLLTSLLKNNVSVVAMTRQKEPDILKHEIGNYNGKLQFFRSDIRNKINLPAGITSIYHCAGVILQEEKMQEVNVEGTYRMVKAALERGCRLIHLSSAGVVGKSKNYLIDENTICKPQNVYESSKYEAEKIVLDGIANGLQAQILRPTIIFGAGRNENQDSFLQLLKAMKRRRYRNIGKGIYNLIHVDEVVRVMRMLDSDTIPNGGIYFINTPIYFRDMDRIVKKQTTGKSEESFIIPYGVAILAGVAFSLLAKLSKRNMPLTLSRVRALANQRVYVQERLVRILKYQPLFSVEEYIKKMCNYYSEQGML
ncbi:ADP-L-glycero-D-manno-heptose-6-epimerase [subsurface metagenome]